MSIGKGKSWAGPLVTKKAVLDILKSDFLFNKGVILQEYHCYVCNRQPTITLIISNIKPLVSTYLQRYNL